MLHSLRTLPRVRAAALRGAPRATPALLSMRGLSRDFSRGTSSSEGDSKADGVGNADGGKGTPLTVGSFFRGDFTVPSSLEPLSAEAIRDKTPVPPGGSRLTRIAPAIMTHMCLGTPYAWSLLAEPLSRELGVAAAASTDWGLMEAAGPMSVCFAFHGIGAALFGKAQIKLGPKISQYLAAFCFGGGTLIGAAGIALHSLPLLYAGYGVLGGLGIGWGYTTALQALVEYFPDRKALASGIAIGGFGTGPIIFSQVVPRLRTYFQADPEFVGTRDTVHTTVENGALVVADRGEVVLAMKADLVSAGLQHLSEGYYLVGTGSTGCASALAVFGTACLASMTIAGALATRPSLMYAVAAPAAAAAAATPGSTAVAPAVQRNVNVDTVMTTPQFYLLATTFLGCAASGMAMFAVAKPMMSSTFAQVVPDLVTPEFAALYVVILSAGNLGGRLLFPLVADSKVGFQRTFQGMTLLSAGSFFACPTVVNTVVSTGSAVPLYAFIGVTTAVVGVMGGSYAVLPAYEASIFGSKYLAANHGRMLLCSTAAALGGPSMLSFLLARDTKRATADLMAVTPPERFADVFGAPIESAPELIDAGTVTISRLMLAVPEGTPDPSPFLFNTTFYAMGGLMLIALTSISSIQPINPSYYEPLSPEELKAAAAQIEAKVVEGEDITGTQQGKKDTTA
jgi:hypothetical protein